MRIVVVFFSLLVLLTGCPPNKQQQANWENIVPGGVLHLPLELGQTQFESLATMDWPTNPRLRSVVTATEIRLQGGSQAVKIGSEDSHTWMLTFVDTFPVAAVIKRWE